MADLDKLSIQIESDAGKATSQLDALSAAMGKLKAALDKLPVTQNNAIKQLGETLGHVSNAAEHSGLKKTSQEMDRVSRSVRKSGSAFKKTSSSVGQFFGSLTRIGMYRGVRLLLSSITSGAKTGFVNLARHSDTAAASLGRLNSVSAYLSNSLGAALGPVVAGLIPILNSLSSTIAGVLNWLNALFAALGGGITFTAAKEVADGLSSSLGGAGGAAKKLKQELMGFDEINSLKPDSDGGGGSSKYKGTFEELPISARIREIADKLKEWLPIIKAAATGFAALAFSSAFLANIDKVGNFAKMLETIAVAGTSYLLSVELVYDFLNNYTESNDPAEIVGAGISAIFGSLILGKLTQQLVPGLDKGFGASIALLLTAGTTLKLRKAKIESGEISIDSVESEVMKIFGGLGAGAAAGLMFENPVGAPFGLSLVLGVETLIDNIQVLKDEGNFSLGGILESEATWTSFLELAIAGALGGFMLTGGPHGAVIGGAVGAGLALVAYVGMLAFDFFGKPVVDDSAVWEYMEDYRSETPNLDAATIELAVALNLVPTDIGIDPSVFAEAQVLVDNLFALQNPDGTFDVDDNRVKAYIQELNALNISGLNEQLALTDGHLAGTKESLQSIIDLERKRAKQQAVVDVLGKSYKTLVEKALEVTTANFAVNRSYEAMQGVLLAVNEYLSQNGKELITVSELSEMYDGNVYSLSASMAFLTSNNFKLYDSLINSSNEFENNKEKAELLKAEQAELAEQVKKVETALEDAVDVFSEDPSASWSAKIKESVESVAGSAKTVVESAKNAFSNLTNHINSMKPVLEITQKIKTVFSGSAVGLAGGLAGFNSMTTKVLEPKAGGGIADAGSLILAGEAGPEIVGQVGNKTGVVNDTQIADIISSQMARNGGGATAEQIAGAVVNAMTGLGVYIGREQVGRVVAQAIDDNRSADGKFAYNLA